MDIKIAGVNLEIMKVALKQATKGLEHILSCMNETILARKSDGNSNAPVIKTIKILREKIKDIIGPGGKIIKEICETTGVKIDISDDGNVKIFGTSAEAVALATLKIDSLTVEPKIDMIYDAQVVKIMDIGIIVKFLGHKESLIHVNDIFISKGQDINSYFKIGDQLSVKFTGYDAKKRCRVTMRIASSSVDETEKENLQLVSEKKYFS